MIFNNQQYLLFHLYYIQQKMVLASDYIHVTDLAQALIGAVKYLIDGNKSDILILEMG